MRPHREGDVPVPGVVADSVLAEAMAERLDQGRTTNRDIVLSPTLVSVRNDRYATVLTGPPAADWAALTPTLRTGDWTCGGHGRIDPCTTESCRPVRTAARACSRPPRASQRRSRFASSYSAQACAADIRFCRGSCTLTSRVSSRSVTALDVRSDREVPIGPHPLRIEGPISQNLST